MNDFFDQFKGKLIVSCQAEEGSPFNSPEGVFKFAKAAELGGASGIRSCGIEKTRYIIEHISLPVIGLTKAYFEDGLVCITGTFEDVEELVAINTPVIAVDGTFRLREQLTGPDFIREIKKKHNVFVMADISTVEEAVACYKAGADCVSTTLVGYTPETKEKSADGRPSFDVLLQCVESLPSGYPVFAEGRFNEPSDAQKAIKSGAWAVVVGSAVSRPHLITRWFAEAIGNAAKNRAAHCY